MNDVAEMLIPAITVSLLFAIFFGFFAFRRYMRYKETIELAERGLLRPPPPPRHKRKRRRLNTLKWGISITTISVGLSCSVWLIGIGADPSYAREFPLLMGPWMVIGILPFFFGLSLLLIYHFIDQNADLTDSDEQQEDETAIPPHKLGG